MGGPETSNHDDVGFALAKSVSEYCEMWRNRYLLPFKVHRHSSSSWQRQPEAAAAGCYAVFSDDGSLLFIGKASSRETMGQRLRAHFEVAKRPWVPLAAYVYLVEVSQAFEAPSLEEFLTIELQPIYNSAGMRRLTTR